MVAVNGGLGISTDLSKWAIRPEYSLVQDISKGSMYRSFSIGLSLNLSLLSKR